MASLNSRRRIVVIGAGKKGPPATGLNLKDVEKWTGVVGLTTAVKIQEKGYYDVTIIAESFPTDPKTIKYTSLWAVSASDHRPSTTSCETSSTGRTPCQSCRE